MNVLVKLQSILATLLLIFFSTCALAQTKIIGRIVDKANSEPIESAVIREITNASNITVSNKNGEFILDTKNKNSSLVISCIGYQPLESDSISGGSHRFELQRGSLDLKEIMISSRSSAQQFSTITQIDLHLRPVNSSQEILRFVPGLFIAQHQGGGKAEQIFLRGFDLDHGTDIEISVDGLPVNMVSHAHGQGYADLHFVIPELVKNIEYGKGPYFADHGNLNTAGYVNLQTVSKLDKNLFQAGAGMYNTFRVLAMINLINPHKENESAYAAGEFLYSDGPFKSPQHFNRFNLYGKYSRQFSTSTKFMGSVSVFNSDWNASGQIPERAVKEGLITRFGSIDNGEGGYTVRLNAIGIVNHRFLNGSEIENETFYTKYYFSLFSNFTFYLRDSINGDQIHQKEKRNLFGDKIVYRQFNKIGNWDLNTQIGAGVRVDMTTNSELSHTKERIEILNRIQLGNISEQNFYSYLNENFHHGPWRIDLGARFDYFNFNYYDKIKTQTPSQQKTIWSPKLNIEYSFNQRLQLYFKSGKGFHTNDTRVVVSNNGYEILPSAYGSDFGFFYKPSSNLILNAAIWYLYLKQEFVYAGDDGTIEPGGKTIRKGIDFSARYQFNKHIFVDANLNLANPRSLGLPKGENYLPLAPTLTSSGGINYQSRQGINGSLRYRLISNRPANENNSIVARGYFLLDAAVNYTKRNYELGLNIENITNANWNEAQFASTSRLRNETSPVTELHFTPGTPFFLKARVAFFF
ncbi:MAG: TonB-dependent receptor [Bacteroidetes bacterium]|nr:MAG: TonB-dependent receptor [Bacteroidota bacterium]